MNIKDDISNFNIDRYQSKMVFSTLISVNKNHFELLFLFFLKNQELSYYFLMFKAWLGMSPLAPNMNTKYFFDFEI